VDDEVVDGDLGDAQQDRQRVGAEDGEADRRLGVGAAGGGVGPGHDGQHDAVAGSGEEPAEPGGGSRTGNLPGEHLLGMRVRSVLADQRQDSGQVVGTRRARHHAGP
jgi:hypothetical protein